MGFLSGAEKSGLDVLEDVLSGKFAVSERMMLECELKGQKLLALNDIVLNRGVFSQVAAYSVSRQGSGNICSFTADGIILATATGSTAYSLSAGGPILEPQLECVAVTPICPHLIGARSSVVGRQTDYRVP